MGCTHGGGLCLCIFVLFLTGVAVRQQDVDLESDGRRVQRQIPEAQVTCALNCSKPSIEKLRDDKRSGQGLFLVDGKEARELSPLLRRGWNYTVRADANCQKPEQGVAGAWSGNDAEAWVVPWTNREDPVNNSSIQIFIHPRTELDLRLRSTEAWLCRENDDPSKAVCLCKLTGVEKAEHWAILGHLATMLPHGLDALAQYCFDVQTAMERRCSDPQILDRALTFIGALVLCFFLVAAEAMIARQRATGGRFFDVPASNGGEKKEYDTPIIITSPWKATQRGVALAFGFVFLIIAWQRTEIRLAIQKDLPDYFVWVSIVFMCTLGIAGIWRFHHILCREQLVQALLANKVGVTRLVAKVWYDGIILAAVCLYVLTFLALNYDHTKSWPNFVVWLVTVSSTLIGLIWAIYKHAQSAQTVDRDLTKVQLNTAGVASLQCPPELTVVAFEQVVGICLEGRDPTNKEELQDQTDGRSFRVLRDIWWHRRLVHQLTQSTTGFCVLPSLALAALLLLAASTVQATNFACSRGELKNLTILHVGSNLHFAPWRDRLVAEMDVTDEGAVLFASAHEDQARRMTYNLLGDGTKDVGEAAAHFHLRNLEEPRVATVDVQGLRDDVGKMNYQVRFAPMSTVPVSVSITSTNQSRTWKRCVGWGSVPGTIITVPPDVGTVNITLHLATWVLGVPNEPTRSSSVESWTAFQETDRNDQQFCTGECNNDPNCLTPFPGHKGCYYAKHWHDLEEKTCWDREKPRGILMHDMVGELCLCEYMSGKQRFAAGCCIKSNASDSSITFSDVELFPPWVRDAFIGVWLAPTMDQESFRSDVGQIRLSHKQPLPFRVLAQLSGKMADGGQMSLPINGTVSWDGDVTLVVPKYDPLKLDPEENLQLSVALLLPDRDFAIKWLESAPTEDQSIPHFTECERSELNLRYDICRGTGKWPVEVMTIEVSRWVGCRGTAFKIIDRTNQTFGSQKFREQRLRCLFESGSSPIGWAVRDHSCDLLDKNEAHDAIATDGDALCVLLNNETCSKAQEEILCEVLSQGFQQASSTDVEMPHGLQPLKKEELSPLLVCGRKAACPALLSPDQWEYNNAQDLVLKPDTKNQTRSFIPLNTFMSAIANLTRSHAKISKRRAPVIKELCNTTHSSWTGETKRVRNFTRKAEAKWLIEPLKTGDVEIFKAVKECFKLREYDLEGLLKSDLGEHGWRERNVHLRRVVSAMWQGADALTDVNESLKLVNESANLAGNVPARMLEVMVQERSGQHWRDGIAEKMPPFNNVKVLTMNLMYCQDIGHLVMALSKAPKLETLRISCQFCINRKLPTDALKMFSEFHKKVPGLLYFHIREFGFLNIMELEKPAKVFSTFESLRRLTLDDVFIPSVAWQHIISPIWCLPELELKSNMLDTFIIKHLVIGLQKRSRDCKPMTVILHKKDEADDLKAELIRSSNSTEAPRALVVYEDSE